MSKKYKVNDLNGLQRVVNRENSDLKRIGFSVLQNSSGSLFEGNSGEDEVVFVIMSGNARVFVSGKQAGEMKRKSVFDEPPTALYLPPYTDYKFEFLDDSEVSCVSCKAKGLYSSKYLQPGDVRIKRTGEDTYHSNVTTIIDGDFEAERIILGEIISDPGNWSSYPPHKHDSNEYPEESRFEGLYFFKIYPKNGFGIIRNFDDREDNLFLVQNNQVVTIPGGYNSVVVIPEHQIYYLWVLAGDTRKVLKTEAPGFTNRKRR